MLVKRVVALTLVMYVCLSGVPCSAQEILRYPQNPGFYQSMELTKFLNSFTSYEFPNPFPPNQSPLSRLEFPIDQWFLGLVTSYAAPSWTLRAEGWINLNNESGRKMQDSDWDDDSNTGQKTIFSESNCRLNRGVLVDVACSFATPLETSFFLRPVVGYRYQRFLFTTHDGFQGSLDGEALDLPGDGIEFKQSFEHWYVGGICSSSIDLSALSGAFPSVRFEFQADYAFVRAKNEDLHLLRVGDHITSDSTRGHCWHLAVGLDLLVSQYMAARLCGDFKRILTDGSHRLTNSLIPIDFSFDGSHVWSDQASISAIGTVSF
jgi:outer membrane protease